MDSFSQIRKSAVSVPSNIAMGSLFEIQTQIQLSMNLNYLDKESGRELFETSREIERMLSSFIRSLDS